MKLGAKRLQTVIGLLGIFLISGPGPVLALAQTAGKSKPTSAGGSSTSPAAIPDSEYRVGPGDILEISVWKEPDVSAPAVIVRPDGKISLPLVNDLPVGGKTTMEIQKLLTEKLDPFLKLPNVTVTVKEIHSKKVYVLGEVVRPGVFDIVQPTTVLQVLTMAGGPQPYAKVKSIYVLRNEGGKQQKLPFNYKDVVRGKKIEENIQLQPGDTVVVP